jgi:hypothetical protein
MHCCVACLISEQNAWLICMDCKKVPQASSTWALVIDHLPGFFFTHATSLIKKCVSFFVGYPLKKKDLLNTVTSDPWNPSTHLAFPAWDTIFQIVSIALQVGRFGDSGSMNYKLDHVTYSNKFSLNSCAIWFMSNVTVNWYTLHILHPI